MSLAVVGRVAKLDTQQNPDTAPLVASHAMHATTPSQPACRDTHGRSEGGEKKNVRLSTNAELEAEARTAKTPGAAG